MAQHNLGIKFVNGTGVAKNPSKGVALFQKAAAQGLVDAQYNLASCFFSGNGVAQNFAQAASWHRKAAD